MDNPFGPSRDTQHITKTECNLPGPRPADGSASQRLRFAKAQPCKNMSMVQDISLGILFCPLHLSLDIILSLANTVHSLCPPCLLRFSVCIKSTSLSLSISLYLSLFLSISLSLCLFCLFCLSVCLSACLSLSVCLPVCLSVCLSVCLPASLCVSLSLYLLSTLYSLSILHSLSPLSLSLSLWFLSVRSLYLCPCGLCL